MQWQVQVLRGWMAVCIPPIANCAMDGAPGRYGLIGKKGKGNDKSKSKGEGNGKGVEAG